MMQAERAAHSQSAAKARIGPQGDCRTQGQATPKHGREGSKNPCETGRSATAQTLIQTAAVQKVIPPF